MRSLPETVGLYLHIPFCKKKCAYCDFYSAFVSETGLDNYCRALISEIKRWGGSLSRPIDTVYFGGGTPSLLGERIIPLMEAVRESFSVMPNAEITAEINPSGDPERFLNAAYGSGIDRISLGVQSGSDERLSLLGRSHSAAEAARTVEYARKIGFRNISVDLMTALPDESVSDCVADAEFMLSLSPEHISCYMLKTERGTRFAAQGVLPADDDTAAEQYLAVCERLGAAGYRHYEISNFALPGCESRHNLKYWHCSEYLGIGPSAYSFLNGERFHYPRDMHGFLHSPSTVSDGSGGDIGEKIMLALRLSEGYDFSAFPDVFPLLKRLSEASLGSLKGSVFSLTARGMLVSNEIITEILEKIL